MREHFCRGYSTWAILMFHFCLIFLFCCCFQAKTLVCAPMENCYSNLMHDDGKGILSLILSLIGLNVTPSCYYISYLLIWACYPETDEINQLFWCRSPPRWIRWGSSCVGRCCTCSRSSCVWRRACGRWCSSVSTCCRRKISSRWLQTHTVELCRSPSWEKPRIKVNHFTLIFLMGVRST